MVRNVGHRERAIRLVLGFGLIGLAYLSTVPTSIVLYVGGLIALVTAAVGFCPAWKLLGISTCGTEPLKRQ